MLETDCPVCAATFGSEDELRWHVQTHLPFPAPVFAFAKGCSTMAWRSA